MINMKKLRKKAAGFAAVILFLSCLKISVAAGESQEEIQLHAQAACLMDGDSGRVLYGKEEETAPSHGQHNKDYDLYSGAGVRRNGRDGTGERKSGRPAESPSGEKRGRLTGCGIFCIR